MEASLYLVGVVDGAVVVIVVMADVSLVADVMLIVVYIVRVVSA